MSRRMRTYYYALLGALGGLIGWQISDLLGLSFASNLYLSEAVVGALVGLSVGLFIGLTEGLMTRNLVQALKSGLFSGILGLGAGTIGLPLSEFFFQTVGAGIFGRALGWAVSCSSPLTIGCKTRSQAKLLAWSCWALPLEPSFP